jgi:hypothetical protein
MYLHLDEIRKALDRLRRVHPFFMLSFLVAKHGRLPVGHEVHFPMDQREDEFLRKHFRVNPRSAHYYAPWSTGRTHKRWVSPDYASSGSQKTRTSTFASAFVHTRGTTLWGWARGYVKVLSSLPALGAKLGRVPAYELAVWVYRQADWPAGSTRDDVLNRFYRDYGITDEERGALFETPSTPTAPVALQDAMVGWDELSSLTGLPPDAPPEEGAVLMSLELNGIGPAHKLRLDLAERLNLISGDNGLGKTFIFECAWWALTGYWAGLPAYPRPDVLKREAAIAYRISRSSREPDRVNYDWLTHSWARRKPASALPGIVVYARVDGSFAVWDPARDYTWPRRQGLESQLLTTGPLVMAKDEAWYGVSQQAADGRVVSRCNGLVRDWVTWQSNPLKHPFREFCAVLTRLSPPEEGDLGSLKPGEPTRLPGDAKEIPTLEHPYGVIPILHASAGVRRIVSLAYLIVWAWSEHKANSELIRKQPQRRMVILVDEVEAHLHPQWQRTIVPALLDVGECLGTQIDAQLLVATHSPMVMLSVEPVFDEARDKLFHLDLDPAVPVRERVSLTEKPFVAAGDADSWLTSDVFQLRQPRSLEAEKAVVDAMRLQLSSGPSRGEVERVSQRLVGLLPPGDSFWPRWLMFASKHGVEL